MKNFNNKWWCIPVVIISALITISCGGGNSSNSNNSISNGEVTTTSTTTQNATIFKVNDLNAESGNQWAFMSGYKYVDQYGAYVGKGVVGGLPGTRAYASGQMDGSGNIWLFGGSGYGASGSEGELNDLWRFDIKSGVWTWLAGNSAVNSLGVYNGSSSVYPGGRHDASSWISSDGKLWEFGGVGYAESQSGYLNDLWRYDTKTNLWTWAGGSKGVNQAGIYGTKGTSDNKNIPGSRYGAASWISADGKLWLFGGYGFATNSSGTTVKGSLNDLWQYDPGSSKWTWISGSNTVNQPGVYGTQGIASLNNMPGARFDASHWIDKSGNLWLLGGSGFANGSNGLLNDLWKYDITLKQWVWINGTNAVNQSGIYGTQGVSGENNMPGSRSAAIAMVESSGTVLLFGGLGIATNNNQGYLNDVWQYDTSGNKWIWISGSASVNQAGIDNEPYVFSSSNLPGGRTGMVGTIDQNAHIWIFGGYGIDTNGGWGNLGDMWEYLPPYNSSNNENTWTWMSGSNGADEPGVYGTKGISSPYNIPGSRYGAVSWSDKKNNKLWLFGGAGYAGSCSSCTLGDLWQYNLITQQWTWMSGSSYSGELPVYGTKGSPSSTNVPGNREFAGSWIDDNSGKLWLFGGYQWTDSGYYKNDLWQYDTVTRYWTWVSGSSDNDVSGIYGTKGVPSVNNMPGGRRGMLTWTDKTGKLWLFGGYSTDGKDEGNYGWHNDLWRYDPSTKEWTWMNGANYYNQNGIYGTKGIPGANNTPTAREKAVGWVDKSGNFWLFGGYNYFNCPSCYGGAAYYSDLWEYNVSTNEWTWVSGSSMPSSEPPVYGILGIADPKNTPGARDGSAVWADNLGNLWLFAGDSYNSYDMFDKNGAGSYVNDLWRYTIDTGLWTWMGGTNLYSQPGIYGVQGIPSLNNIPGGRYSLVSWVDNEGASWLFGGYGISSSAHGQLNDLWRYIPPSN